MAIKREVRRHMLSHMLSHIVMRNVIPEDMADSASVLCRGDLTPENILLNYNNSDLTILDIDKCIELFTHRHYIATTKLHDLACRLTNEPELIRLLTAPELTPDALRRCHGRLIRVHTDQMVKNQVRAFHEKADQMVKKKVQMFHDTAQEWCDAVDEFMQGCDRRAPPLYRCERVE